VKKKVLVVDDDADTRSLLSAILRDFSVDVVEASQDEEGFRRFLEVGPALILLDLLLPRQGGLALLRKIRGVRGGKQVPVLVMSAVYKRADVRAEAIDQLGALDFLKKPFHMDALRTALSSVLADETSFEQSQDIATFPTSELLARGDLAAVEFPVLLRNLELHKATGRLNLRQGSAKKVVFFQEGEIVFALSNQIRETLGRYLFSIGRISEEDYQTALVAVQRDGKRMGEFLVQREALSEEAVYGAIRANIRDKVLDLFSWQSGDFHLSPYSDPPAPLPGQPFEISKVLWDGVRGRFPHDRISAALAARVDFSLLPRLDLAALSADVAIGEGDMPFLRLLGRLKGQPLGKALSEVRAEGELRLLYLLLLRGDLALAGPVAGADALGGVDLPDRERIRRAERRRDSLRERNCFQVLDMPLDASDAKVREAYLRKAKEIHPDMLGTNDHPELHRLHGETFQIVQAAYESLKTQTRRQEYLKFLQEGLVQDISDGSSLLEAETQYMEGKLHLKRQAWGAAEAALRKAVKMNPDEGEYLLWLGIAALRNGTPGEKTILAEAAELFSQAMARLPASPEPCYRLGKLAAGRGEIDKAIEYFQTALARSPDHLESLRELRLIRLRSDGKRGVFHTFLGKKEPAA
jgi:DNA-binding response OmpR family regulator/curved DNA-binding protein CbpA